jgi:hypothetical protein
VPGVVKEVMHVNNFPDQLRPGQGDVMVSAGGDVNGVTVVKEMLGVIFLGFLTIFLLIALQRAHARNRELLTQLRQQDRS